MPSRVPRTLLAVLLVERGWTAEKLCRVFAQTAASLKVRTTDVSLRQARRWIAAENHPQPPAARVLEQIFGTPIDELLAPPKTPVPVQSAAIYSETRGEEEPTDRRDFIGVAALSLTAADVLGRTPNGAEALTIADLESDVDDIATSYGSTPYLDLLPYVADRWHRVREIRSDGLPPPKRPRVNLLAGQYAYFLGRISFNLQDFRAARRFAEIAGGYADVSREPVLVLSVAALHSSIAYHTRRYRAAVDALNSVNDFRHPYMDARIAAYLARAYAKQGDHANALAALDRMEATACTMTPMPGETPVGPAAVAMFRSSISLMIGRTDMAREWAPLAEQGYQSGGGDFTTEEAQHADVTRALLLLSDRKPEPEEAARVALRLVTGSSGPVTHTVAARLRQCVATFSAAQRDLPDVAALLSEYRALPATTGQER